MQKRTFGLLGFPLTHSFSKPWFEKKFITENLHDCSYENFAMPKIDGVKLLLDNPNLFGFNVTIPFKKEIIPYLHHIHPVAQAVGAVNCVKRENEVWVGFNTDVIGFEMALRPLLLSTTTSAIVLGSGGAYQAVAFVLKKLGINFITVSSREKEGAIRYVHLTEAMVHSHTLIINTTPLGMFPKLDDCPLIPYNAISPDHICFDLIYNPEETLFLKKAKGHGAIVKNGLEMLTLQAEKSWDIWGF